MIALGSRLRRINALAIGVAIATVAVIVLVSTFVMGAFKMVDASRAQAMVMADNAAAPLMFEDVKSATEVLQSLRHLPDVKLAALYREDGKLLPATASASMLRRPR